uniref:C-type lectin domain-containing protein n=1 Tax=Poecilia mexicana TaxID=48701 RepID=A0A3B3X6J1_9TELE
MAGILFLQLKTCWCNPVWAHAGNFLKKPTQSNMKICQNLKKKKKKKKHLYGWASFQGSCYLLSTTTNVWQRAEDQCRSSGGHLLVLNNVEELDYISGIVDIKYSYWIGLVERQHEGHWSWVDGTDFGSTPTFWDQGQPDNWDFRVNGEDCGQLHASGNRKRKLWNDADCSLGYRYICEAKA